MARPAFKPTPTQRYRVSVLAAARMPKVDIARALGIDAKTLGKHFADELSTGIAKRNAEMLEAMFRAGKRGNVAAQKAWLARQDLEPPPAAGGEAPAEKLGKKEQAQRDALTADEGTSWSSILN
jgi:hypothetical protein